MKSFKLIAPVNNTDDIEALTGTECKSVFVYQSDFIKKDNAYNEIHTYINKAKELGFEIFVNFKSTIKENEIERAKEFLTFLTKTQIDGILINSYAILEFIKSKELPFKLYIDSGLNIHNLSGLDFIHMFHKIEKINITEEGYIRNLSLIKKYTKEKVAIDSNNISWIAQDLQKYKVADTILIKGDFEKSEDLVSGIQLIEKILSNPKIFKNQKLPFRGLNNVFYSTNHFTGDFQSSDGNDFKFSENISRFEWKHSKTRLIKNHIEQQESLPKINMRLSSFEQVKKLKNFIKKIGYNPVQSIEYGEILSTVDLAKNSFNDILEYIKKFCYENNIKLSLSTPRVLIERDFERVYEYVKILFESDPYPSSITINNIGYWWAIINDADLEWVPKELGPGLHLLNSQSILSLANQNPVNTVDLSNIADLDCLKTCTKAIKNHIPNRKLTIAGNIRIRCSGLCPLNNDSAILSRLSCAAPCHNGAYAICDPSNSKCHPFTVDGFCRMHLFEEKILDLYKHLDELQKIGINEFVIDCSSLSANLVPVLLTRLINSLNNKNYKADPAFSTSKYGLGD